MVNIIPTIVFDVLLVGGALALFVATLRSILPRGVALPGLRSLALRRPRQSVRGDLRPFLVRVEPLTTRRQGLARRASWP